MASDDMIGGPGYGKWIIVALIVIAIPCIFALDVTLEAAQRRINEHPRETWAPALQRAIAVAYKVKLRPADAAHRYEWAARLYAHQNDAETAGEMTYSQADCWEDANDKATARQLYETLAHDFHGRPLGQRAEKSLVRLKTMSRP